MAHQEPFSYDVQPFPYAAGGTQRYSHFGGQVLEKVIFSEEEGMYKLLATPPTPEALERGVAGEWYVWIGPGGRRPPDPGDWQELPVESTHSPRQAMGAYWRTVRESE